MIERPERPKRPYAEGECRRRTAAYCLLFQLVLELSGALDDRCLPSADCLEEYLRGRLPALRCQSVCLSGFNLRL
ncbi:hypothetical protein AMECASPLE_023212, partial [Ameca splendens]